MTRALDYEVRAALLGGELARVTTSLIESEDIAETAAAVANELLGFAEVARILLGLVREWGELDGVRLIEIDELTLMEVIESYIDRWYAERFGPEETA